MTEHGLLEVEFEVMTQVGATKDLLTATATAAAEDVAEHVAEDVAEGIGSTESATAACREPLVTMLIVDCTLLRIRQHFVRFFRFLEFLLGLVVIYFCPETKGKPLPE